MTRDRLVHFVHLDPPPGDPGGVYRNPRPGIYERGKVRRPRPYDDADTASPKIYGNYTTEGKQKRALIIHPDFPRGST